MGRIALGTQNGTIVFTTCPICTLSKQPYKHPQGALYPGPYNPRQANPKPRPHYDLNVMLPQRQDKWKVECFFKGMEV